MALDKETLKLADLIYTKASLKPMSKTLFFISRVFLILNEVENVNEVTSQNISKLNKKLKLDTDSDYSFEKVLKDLGENLDEILKRVTSIFNSRQTDALGGVFNSLLRGKFEAGEGFGTFLTPEEVVGPCAELLNGLFEKYGKVKKDDLFADITGGTGSFMLNCYSIFKGKVPSKNFHILDQSRTHLGFAESNFKLNFNSKPTTTYTEDSLLEQGLSKKEGKLKGLMTNPPFGQSKYIVCEKVLSQFDTDLLKVLNIKKKGDRTDPAWLFLLKNINLLKRKGIMAIVLPNGICQSELFVDLLKAYEKRNKIKLSIPYIFDLPVATFALGGTVAKTSILFIAKDIKIKTKSKDIFHIGFLKKGNNKVLDACGNDLESFVATELPNLKKSGQDNKGVDWREFTSLSPKILNLKSINLDDHEQVSNVAKITKNYFSSEPGDNHFHVTIQDVDDTGTINLINCGKFFPVTKPLQCEPYDLLVSCLNPKIWRVALVPNLKNIDWTCSPEFAVLRTKSKKEAFRLFFAFQTSFVKDQVIALGKGTSSSRQRVKKELLSHVSLPDFDIKPKFIQSYESSKIKFYDNKIVELKILEELGSLQLGSERVNLTLLH